MLRSLGVRLSGPTLLIGDNLGSLQSSTRPGAQCKKKHSQVAYHYVREMNAAGEVRIKKIHTDFNLADPFTKGLPKVGFWRHFKKFFH